MKALVELHGAFTYARLKGRGYSDAQIKEAITTGFLESRRDGSLVVERRKRAQLLENPLIGLGSMSMGEGIDDHMPGQHVARVIDGEIQRMQVVRDLGRELSVVDPDNQERIISIAKDDVADAGEEDFEDTDNDLSPGVYGEGRTNWLRTGAESERDSRQFTMADVALGEGGKLDLVKGTAKEVGSDVAKVAKGMGKGVVDHIKPVFTRGPRRRKGLLGTADRLGDVREGEKVYTVPDEAVDADDPYTVGEAADDRARKGALKSLKSMHSRIQGAQGKMFDRLDSRMKEMKKRWNVKDDKEYTRYHEGVGGFCDMIDDVDESVRPRELPDALQGNYSEMRIHAKDGMNGEEAVCMYYPSFTEGENGRLAIVPDSQIEQEMANGALMINEALGGIPDLNDADDITPPKPLGPPGPFYIYFDYTGAGRGPEIIDGPYDTKEEAEAIRVRDYGEADHDYWVDVEYVEPDYCDHCGEEIGADGSGHHPGCEGE